jgi:NAD(P)-dependent dehydrogenase (short-subunit alcohol dehydrogenase family)
MAWGKGDIPDQRGKVAVVTGSNGGLGLETAKALAGVGAHVVVAARDQVKTSAAIDLIKAAHPDAVLEVVTLDLASLASVREAAAAIVAKHDRVDVLVNNAGIMAIPERATEDGFEMQLGVNHLGHFVLTARLLPLLLRANGRVVSVTSTAHHLGRRLDPENPHLHGRYGPWRAYGQSKLANYHFAIGLHVRLQAAGVEAASLLAHPGLSNTELQVHSVEATGGASQRFFRWLAATAGMSPARGALPQLRAATDPSARSGQLYAPRFVNSGAPVRRPIMRQLGLRRAIDVLWEVSERETGEVLDVAVAMGTLS